MSIFKLARRAATAAVLVGVSAISFAGQASATTPPVCNQCPRVPNLTVRFSGASQASGEYHGVRSYDFSSRQHHPGGDVTVQGTLREQALQGFGSVVQFQGSGTVPVGSFVLPTAGALQNPPTWTGFSQYGAMGQP